MICLTKTIRFCYRLPGDDFVRTGVLVPRVYGDFELPRRGMDCGGALWVETRVGVDGEHPVIIPLANHEWRTPFESPPT
jgi:hypothetical protein